MPLTLTPGTDRETIAARMARDADRAAVRTGDPRRRRLEKNVRRLSRNWETRVEIDPECPTTRLEMEAEDPPTIVITGRRISQPVTDYSPRAWDWLLQRGFAVHESAHLRYSDFDDWERRLSTIEAGKQGVAQTCFNALEDGAIERQIVRRWPNYEAVLRAIRVNRLESATMGVPDPERGGILYPLAHAIHAAIIERWLARVYGIELGVVEALLDPEERSHHFAPNRTDRQVFTRYLLPAIETVVPEVLNTPGARERNERIERFLDTVLSHLEGAVDGRQQQAGRAGTGMTGDGMPDDARENESGSATATADALDAGEADLEGGGPEPTGESPGDVRARPELEAQAAETAGDDARAPAETSEQLLEELEEFSGALARAGKRGSPDLEATTVTVPTGDREGDHSLANRAREDAKPLERLFRNRLQHERRTEIRRGTRQGRLDTHRLYRTAVQERPSNLKCRRIEPEEKDYSIAFVLDRSASMGRRIRQAELAMGSLLYALEGVGVETMVLELLDSQIWLAKPFGEAVDRSVDQLFHGGTGGGTPLSTVLEVVRARLSQKATPTSRRVMVVLTDDAPADPESFAATIAATTFPVLGVNLAASSTTGTYTRSVAAKPGEDLQETLRQLVTDVLL